MTLPTGVQAIAENNYGRPNEALDYLKRMTRTFSYALPGGMYEVSPDYGMMAQAWNIYAYAVPIVQQFFGIRPMAQNKMVIIKPQMPDDWDNAKLENVKVADNVISVTYQKEASNLRVAITQTNPDWTIQLVLPKNDYVVINGDSTPKTEGNSTVFETSSKQLEVSLNIE